MKSIRAALVLLPLFFASSPLSSQEAPARTLRVNRAVSDSLGPDDKDAYTIELPAERFVYGVADQHTMDVVITVFDPDGELVEQIDFSARGADPFQFDAHAPGRYRIEISPFEKQTGRYTLVVRRVEPIATEPPARVDQVMAAYAEPGVPGGVIGVVRDGRLAFARAYGSANLTHALPFSVDSRTNIGSTSKQFTAFAILMLAERGELSLDDDVREHIPELPDLGHMVTLRHLLTHTSGYREFLNTLALAGRRLDRGDYIDRSEILDLIERQPELQNDPGAEWNYNNSGFALLTVVLERVTGEEFPDWMRANVFAPLGMENTFVRELPSQIIRNSAQGYATAEDGGWREVTDLSGAMGAGGIYTTVGDLARWIGNFQRPRVGPPDAFRRMTTRYVLVGGDTTDYGLGLFVDEYRGLRRVQHGGADAAHRATLAYFPTLGAGVVALSNNASFDAAAIADRVADVFFAEHLEPAETDEPDDAPLGVAAAFDPALMDEAAFEGLAGRFALDVAPGFILRFFHEDGRFWTQATGQSQIEMIPTSESSFALTRVEASVTFHRNADGRADSVTLHQNGDHRARRIGGAGWEPSPADLAAYTGRFYSTELETFYELALEDDALVLRHRRLEEDIALTPAGERDDFAAGFPIGQVEFLRNEAGDVTGFQVSNGRTRGVRFDRME